MRRGKKLTGIVSCSKNPFSEKMERDLMSETINSV